TSPSTLSLHDALPISPRRDQILGQGQDRSEDPQGQNQGAELVPELAEKAHGGRRNEGSRDKLCREKAFNPSARCGVPWRPARLRSEEHTSELQSLRHL